MTVDDDANGATVFSVGQVSRVDDEVLTGSAGIVATWHVLLPPALGNHYAAALPGELGSGVGLDLFDQGFIHCLPAQGSRRGAAKRQRIAFAVAYFAIADPPAAAVERRI